MTNAIIGQPEGATPLDDISGLIRGDVTNRKQLDEAETLNIVSAIEWMEAGRFANVYTVGFYQELHARMFDQVWRWAGALRSKTGITTNIGAPPAKVPFELGRVAMDFRREWEGGSVASGGFIPFVARYHHALVRVHPFNNGNGRWSRLATDVVVERLARASRLVWAANTLDTDSAERAKYIAALKEADAGNLQPLIEYIQALNPNH
jgi:Fic-DOC domain mobile mystery protein B